MNMLPFILWRQDDNGQRFIVGRFATHADAEQRLQQLTHVPHKQIYWIEAGTMDEPDP